MRSLAGALVAVVVALSAGGSSSAQLRIEQLTASDSLPAHLAGRFRDPVQFAQISTGEYLVLDRRAHTVSRIDRRLSSITQVIDIGFEEGRVLVPTALAVGPDDVFAVADAPNSYERVQYFTGGGSPLGGFFLDTPVAPRLTLGPLVLNGLGSMQFTGDEFLISQPGSGALVTALNMDGHPVRRFGVLRSTGHEADPPLHLAMNVGMPLVDPTGGYYFVFQSGRPAFRKYDAAGELVFERHIEGVELDPILRTLPTSWPTRETRSGVYPIVTPTVRTAGVDRTGRLWVSLTVPFTYVYDSQGDKVGTVQFRAAGTVSPSSLFFTADNRILVTPGCVIFTQPGPLGSVP